MPGPLAHRPQDFQFGATPIPMNQGLHPLNTATQYPWGSYNSLHSSWENLSAPSLSRGNLYSDNVMGLDQPNQYFNATGSNQNTASLFGAQVMSGG